MKKIAFLALFLVIVIHYGSSQNNKVCLEQTKSTWFESHQVNDKYLIQCYIPENHKTSLDLLPIVFILDGDMSFAMTYDIVRWLRWRNEIPEVAIVGITYGTGQEEWWQKRSRDYSISYDTAGVWGEWPLAGGGENFIKFIEYELFPFIASEYNLKSESRTIIGLSFGGLISLDILFSSPDLFKNYIVAGPALQWNNKEIFGREEAFSKQQTTLNKIVFSSIGSLDNDKYIIDPWDDFNKQVREHNYNGLIYETAIIKDETHISMFPAALTKGLKYVLNQKQH